MIVRDYVEFGRVPFQLNKAGLGPDQPNDRQPVLRKVNVELRRN